MAIINLTPDSFYAASRRWVDTPPLTWVAPDGRSASWLRSPAAGARSAPGASELPRQDPSAAVARAGAALEAGADLLDLGAESTRPGAAPLAAAEEQERLLPSLEAVRRQFPAALLSVDTRHGATARRALDAGADIINDVSGLEDAELAAVCKASRCGVVLMHSRGEFASMHRLPPLADPLATVEAGLEAIAGRAGAAGLAPERMVLDPGFGFGKNLDENFPLLAGLDRLHRLGCPLLVGLSRKSFLRNDSAQPPEERLPASLAAATAAALAGAHIVRTHDVAATVAALRIADRLLAQAHKS
ncbi:MAG TPA: dihydropteroate synthase [Terriglobales bacterium]|nr:dihydropteroate synthase [Terriglobales bacterium]